MSWGNIEFIIVPFMVVGALISYMLGYLKGYEDSSKQTIKLLNGECTPIKKLTDKKD